MYGDLKPQVHIIGTGMKGVICLEVRLFSRFLSLWFVRHIDLVANTCCIRGTERAT